MWISGAIVKITPKTEISPFDGSHPKAAREFQYIQPTHRKRSTKNSQKNAANREKESIR